MKCQAKFMHFHSKKMYSKISSEKWRPFCLGLNVLTHAVKKALRNFQYQIYSIQYEDVFSVWWTAFVYKIRQNQNFIAPKISNMCAVYIMILTSKTLQLVFLKFDIVVQVFTLCILSPPTQQVCVLLIENHQKYIHLELETRCVNKDVNQNELTGVRQIFSLTLQLRIYTFWIR